MTITLNDGTTMEVAGIEEAYYTSNTNGIMLNIRMQSDDDIATLKDRFNPQATEIITVTDGDNVNEISGYTKIDSIRRLYAGTDGTYNTAIDLVK